MRVSGPTALLLSQSRHEEDRRRADQWRRTSSGPSKARPLSASRRLFLVVAAAAVVALIAFAPSVAASPRSGHLQITKECSEYTGQAGSFCTFVSSNIKAIPTGAGSTTPRRPGPRRSTPTSPLSRGRATWRLAIARSTSWRSPGSAPSLAGQASSPTSRPAPPSPLTAPACGTGTAPSPSTRSTEARTSGLGAGAGQPRLSTTARLSSRRGAFMIDGVTRRGSSSIFVGRRAELDRLDEAFKQSALGVPSVSLIAGDAGVGKSRLVAELLARVEATGAWATVGGCLDLGEGGLPYAPFVEALRGLVRRIDRAANGAVLGPSADVLAALLPDLRRPGAETPSIGVPDDPAGRLARLFDAVLDLLGVSRQTGLWPSSSRTSTGRTDQRGTCCGSWSGTCGANDCSSSRRTEPMMFTGAIH